MSGIAKAPADTAPPDPAHDPLDRKDARSHGATAQAAQAAQALQDEADAEKSVSGAELARQHGKEPSRGARIDEELQKEEEELLAKKDADGKGSN